MDAVLAASADAGADRVVVHCALSQVRGPACGSRLATRLAEKRGGADGDGGGAPTVEVLAGGYDGWAASVGPADEWTAVGKGA